VDGADSLAVSERGYEAAMARRVAARWPKGFTHVAFADLFLEDVAATARRSSAAPGSRRCFRCFGDDTRRPPGARDDRRRLRARITCVDPRQLDRRFAGREFDADLLAELPPASIRAASAASSTPAPTTVRCSAGRSRSTPASRSNATASSSRT
jgi:hypothetical protein